ncbi:two-component sensor histidine kinase [Bacilli bacterium]|nr:two-component sensor histidine kinase [Bacilli bacterium]
MGKIPSNKRQPKKRSIMLKWSFANMIFCFLVFTIFVIISYQSSVLYFLEGEKDGLVSVVDSAAKKLETSSDNLTPDNIYKYLDYQEPNVLDNLYDEAGHVIKSAEAVGIPGVSWRSFQVYDVSGQMIFTTQSSSIPLANKKSTAPVIVTIDNQSGYITTREIKSKKTGQVIGYLQSFNNLEFYYNIRNKLLFILIALEIVAMFLANFIGYFVSNHFLKPLSKLYAAMKKMTHSPSSEFEKVEIHSGDEIEELADVFNQMMSKTHDYIEGQERFVSDVSHELRTPLAVLDGHINLLLRWGKDDPEQLVESLEASRHEIKKMSSMIQDMLDISRLKQLDDFITEETVVEDSVTDLINNMKMIHQTSEFTFEDKLDDPQAKAQINQNHYIQALTILIDNAIKYSGEGESFVKVTLAEDDKHIITSVADRGLGICEEDKAHVFERFFRADKARNREIGGTGLGLSIIANIAQIYHGSVSVESELGKGSVFTLVLPKANLK